MANRARVPNAPAEASNAIFCNTRFPPWMTNSRPRPGGIGTGAVGAVPESPGVAGEKNAGAASVSALSRDYKVTRSRSSLRATRRAGATEDGATHGTRQAARPACCVESAPFNSLHPVISYGQGLSGARVWPRETPASSPRTGTPLAPDGLSVEVAPVLPMRERTHARHQIALAHFFPVCEVGSCKPAP